MAFRTVKTSEEHVKDYTGDGGNYLNKSGMYEVVIKAVIVDSSPSGSEYLNLWVEYNGQEQPIFQAMRLTNNDGSENLGAKLFTKLCVIAGATDGAEIPDPVTRMIPIGEKGAEKECRVLEIFDDTPVHLRLQMEYGMYEGKVQERKNIRNFFRFENKATAAEIINETEAGKQYEQELEYADKITLKDGLTEEDVAEWKKNRRKGDSSKKEEPKKPAGGFSGKRFGNKS